MIKNAKEKLESQAKVINSKMAELMCQQIIEMITDNHRAEKVLNPEKSLEGCKKEFDSYARKNKTGNESVITPDMAEKLICEYFGFTATERETETIINIMDFI